MNETTKLAVDGTTLEGLAEALGLVETAQGDLNVIVELGMEEREGVTYEDAEDAADIAEELHQIRRQLAAVLARMQADN